MSTETNCTSATGQLTLGERRVRVDFNVSSSSVVDCFKADTATLINVLEGMRTSPEGVKEENIQEYNRLISLAQTAYEEACMWAVKASTM